MSHKKRPNRMLKEEPVERQAVVKPTDETEIKEVEGVPKGFPCRFCRGKTKVVYTYPTFETSQEPPKYVRTRRRQCTECGRTFCSQEICFKHRPQRLDNTTDEDIFLHPPV